jgi:hypothetical protein
MKNPKNILYLNNLSTYYITLHGLQGVSLQKENPFSIYFTQIVARSIFMVSVKEIIIPNDLLHIMIKEAYDFYLKLDEIEDSINPMMREQVTFQLGSETSFNEFLNMSINTYKKSFFSLLNNFNSNVIDYNNIKIKILEDKMNEYVLIEDYEMAANMRDKIAVIKNKI